MQSLGTEPETDADQDKMGRCGQNGTETLHEACTNKTVHLQHPSFGTVYWHTHCMSQWDKILGICTSMYKHRQ